MVDDKDVKKVMIEHAKNLEKIFSQDDIHEIVEAAYRHSERNQTDQSETQITLMDADRLANMQSAVIIRGGQFRPTLPALDFNYLEGAANPLSTYERPMTVLDNLRFIIYNFPPQLRLPEAKRLGVIYTDRLSSYIKSVEDDHKELGLKNISF